MCLTHLIPSEAPHAMAISPLPNRTNYLFMSPAPSQGVVVQGRLFQHTHLPSPVRKPVQRYSTADCTLSFSSVLYHTFVKRQWLDSLVSERSDRSELSDQLHI